MHYHRSVRRWLAVAAGPAVVWRTIMHVLKTIVCILLHRYTPSDQAGTAFQGSIGDSARYSGRGGVG